MKTWSKLILTLSLNMLLALPLHAKLVKEKKLQFNIETKTLLKGNVQYAVRLLSPKELKKKYPKLRELDSLQVLKVKDSKVMLGKSAFIVNRPAGFFDHQHMMNEDYVAHLMGDQTVKKTGDNSFRISVSNKLNYVLKTYFDSDDISTLPNSKVIQAVTTARALDVISHSATSIIFKEMSDYTQHGIGSTSFSSFIPLKEDKTLVIVYTLAAMDPKYAEKKDVKKNFIKEIEVQKNLIESFKQQ